jgi:O-antigen/teichoic acid export membrane protein
VFRRVLNSSGVLFRGNSISLGLNLFQSILAARLLGPAGFGLVAIVMGYASTINGLLSFRMGEVVVRYGGEYLEKGESERAAALIKAASLSEAAASVAAFAVVGLSATLAALLIAKAPEAAWLFVLYALGLLANFNAETSTGTLQILGKIKVQGLLHAGQSIVTSTLMALVFVARGDVTQVLCVYLAGKIILGLGTYACAAILLTRRLGFGWWSVRLATLPRIRQLAGFAVSSNLSATAILVFRESEILWVGYFLTNEAAGFYKAAYAIASLLSVPANPLILSTHPEINKLVVQQAWGRLQDFLRKVTWLAMFYNLALAASFVLFGRWLLSLYGTPYMAAYPALVVLIAGLAFNYSLFWNRPLLLSLGLPNFPLKATLAAGLAKTGLAFLLVPRLGIVAAAGLLSSYYLVSVGSMVWRGLTEIRRKAGG